MALSSLSGRRAVAGLLQRSALRPSPVAASSASQGTFVEARRIPPIYPTHVHNPSTTTTVPLRASWARSYSWHGARAAASSSSSSLLLHAPSARREERAKQQPA